jgi:hypothetical protein
LASPLEEGQYFEEVSCVGFLRLGDEVDREVCLEVESDRDGEGVLLSHLGSYSPCLVGEPGHFDWVVQCAKAICPIVGISCEGHHDQLLALLTFLEEERWLESLATSSKRGSKVQRVLKNLECLVDYNTPGKCSSCGKGKVRACPVFL